MLYPPLLQDLATRYGLAASTAQQLVVERQGDLDGLAASLAQQQAATLGYGASQQQPQQPAGAAQQQQPGALLPSEPAGAGLFGTLGGGDSAYSGGGLESWGAATACLDSASSHAGAGASCFSAFGFGGFAEAALHAVHGGGGGGAPASGLLGGGAVTPSSRDHVSTLGSGIWGNTSTSSAAQDAYSSDDHLLAMLGVHADGGVAAPSSSSSSSSAFLPFPGASALPPPPQAPPQAQQWLSGEGLAHQPAFVQSSLWGAAGASGSGMLAGGGSTDQNQNLLVR